MAQRPFQFHLSTMLIAMLVVGAFAGLNFRSYQRSTVNTSLGFGIKEIEIKTMGWPLICFTGSDSLHRVNTEWSWRFSSNSQVSIIPFFANVIFCMVFIWIFDQIANRYLIGTKEPPANDPQVNP